MQNIESVCVFVRMHAGCRWSWMRRGAASGRPKTSAMRCTSCATHASASWMRCVMTSCAFRCACLVFETAVDSSWLAHPFAVWRTARAQVQHLPTQPKIVARLGSRHEYGCTWCTNDTHPSMEASAVQKRTADTRAAWASANMPQGGSAGPPCGSSFHGSFINRSW